MSSCFHSNYAKHQLNNFRYHDGSNTRNWIKLQLTAVMHSQEGVQPLNLCRETYSSRFFVLLFLYWSVSLSFDVN